MAQIDWEQRGHDYAYNWESGKSHLPEGYVHPKCCYLKSHHKNIKKETKMDYVGIFIVVCIALALFGK